MLAYSLLGKLGAIVEFDINLILVPITLVLLVVYLADKLWLKQHRFVKEKQKMVSMTETNFDNVKKTFVMCLHARYGIDDPDRFTTSDSTPPDVMVLYDDYHTARRKLAEAKSHLAEQKEFFLVNWAYEFLPILAFLVVVRSFIVEPFNIPSSSMVPTLYTGDFIVVNKSAYGLRLPITHNKILDTGSPKHGDVAVFRYPENPKRYYIKRVIGLPNDTVGYDNGVLSINGKRVDSQEVNYQMDDKLVNALYPSVINGQTLSDLERSELGKLEEAGTKYYQETLGEHTYRVRYTEGATANQIAPFLQANSPTLAESRGQVWEIKVPDGQYFVMGDNRERSEDSRFWGFVPENHLAGKATYIWMHKEAGLKIPSFSRAGKID